MFEEQNAMVLAEQARVNRQAIKEAAEIFRSLDCGPDVGLEDMNIAVIVQASREWLEKYGIKEN